MEETMTVKRKTTGRRKIEIKRIEKKNNLQVTFSKRRKGLFNKAAELSVLCGADVAVLVQSPAGKVFACGGRAPIDSIIDRYLAAGTPSISSNNAVDNKYQQEGLAVVGQDEEEEKKFMEITKKIEAEKAKEKSLMQGKVDSAKGFWWEQPVDNLKLNELEEYMTAMECLKKNVLNKAEEMANAADNNNDNVEASSSILIPNVTLDCYGGLPVPLRHCEFFGNKDNVDNSNDQPLMLQNLLNQESNSQDAEVMYMDQMVSFNY